MLRTLRRMRAKLLAEGQLGRYCRYAVGELLLVVIGILIALQLNAVRQDQLLHQELRGYAHTMIADLEKDLEMLVPIEAEMRDVRLRGEQLGDYVEGKSIGELRNIDLFYLMRAPYYRPYKWSTSGIEQMKSAGALSRIGDHHPDLTRAISAYEALKSHLEDDYHFDLGVGTRALALASEFIDMNYPDFEVFFDMDRMEGWTPLLDEEEGMEFPDTYLHRLYPEDERALLTDDIRQVQAAVNLYLQLATDRHLRPRTEIEMPLIRGMIRDLIQSLQVAYP